MIQVSGATTPKGKLANLQGYELLYARETRLHMYCTKLEFAITTLSITRERSVRPYQVNTESQHTFLQSFFLLPESVMYTHF